MNLSSAIWNRDLGKAVNDVDLSMPTGWESNSELAQPRNPKQNALKVLPLNKQPSASSEDPPAKYNCCQCYLAIIRIYEKI